MCVLRISQSNIGRQPSRSNVNYHQPIQAMHKINLGELQHRGAFHAALSHHPTGSHRPKPRDVRPVGEFFQLIIESFQVMVPQKLMIAPREGRTP